MSLYAQATCLATLAWNCPGMGWGSARTGALHRRGGSSEGQSPGILISFCTVTQNLLRLTRLGIS